MAVMQPMQVKITSPLGKCVMCLDRAIGSGPVNIDLIPDAVASVPYLQMFSANGQQIAGVMALPVCRAGQLGSATATGRLLTA